MRMAPKEEKQGDREKYAVPNYKTLLSQFDGYVASEKIGSGVRALNNGFQIGDMVWGKVKSHPWWPGHIYNEAFASPSVRHMRRVGHVLVAFFGDSSYGWFDPVELIPFEPHVAEKSQQTNSTHFVSAVVEAMDEACRRSALGLTCKCRNPYNFRPTNVQGYFTVEVPDYELQTVYSSDQIKKARDSFSSVRTLCFVKQCALAPQMCDSDSLKFLQKKAAVSVFRRAVFEEFDETYDQAFRARSAQTLVNTQEVHNRAPPRAPLSGENRTKVKDQDKSLPKRREKAGDMIVQYGQVQSSYQLQRIGASTGDYVLGRKTQSLQTPKKYEQTGLVNKSLAQESKERMEEKAKMFPEYKNFEAMTRLKQDDAVTHSRSKECSLQPFVESHHISSVAAKRPAEAEIKKVIVPKRSFVEMSFTELKNKKINKKELGSDNAEGKKAVGNSKLDVLRLLSNLRALSLDPFFGSMDRSSHRAVRQFFSRFRSLAYQKSLAITPSDAGENVKDTKPPKSVRIVSRPEEPSKSGKKRFSSDLQEDISQLKKLKKTSQLRSMASDKKTSQEAKESSNLAPAKPVREQGGSVPIQAKPTKAPPVKKTSLLAKVKQPTMLVLKFPPETSLPSSALLKARFGRFGLLDQSAIRVFWKSSTCRVVFLYKADAQSAFSYASKHNSLFGSVKVSYLLRDVEASAAEGHEPHKANADGLIKEPQNQWHAPAPPVHQPTLPPPNIQLKSCSKKPSIDPGGNRGTAGVKFISGGKEKAGRGTEPPNSRFRSNNGSYTDTSGRSNGKPKPKPVNNVDHVDPASGNTQGLNQSPSTVDISQQMLNLLSKCNDVVTNLTDLLGYVPYQSL